MEHTWEMVEEDATDDTGTGGTAELDDGGTLAGALGGGGGGD